MSSEFSPAPGPRLPRWFLPALLAVIAVTFGLRNLPWHLDDYDQAKQAWVSFEMVETGHWWYQHTPVGRIATKPPLAGWISAGLALGSGGAWELAWRLPPLLCALGLLLLLARGGRRVGGEAGAVLAAGAFGLNVLAPRLATLVRTDMLLAFCIFMVGWYSWRKVQSQEPWTTAERGQVCGFILASMLIKGPIVYAFLLPGLAAFRWLERRSPRPAQAWSGWWSWLLPLGLFGLWAGYGMWSSPEFYEQVFLREFLGRFEAGENAPHRSQPPWFYLAHLLYRFFPWSVLLLAMGLVPDVRGKLRRDPAMLWLIVWALGGLVVMSCIPSKRVDRIFPVLPPLCLLLAAWVPLWSGWHALRAPARWLYVAVCLGLLGSGAYLVEEVVQGFRRHEQGLRLFGEAARAQLGPQPCTVVSGKDEGMLLYLRELRFTRLEEAQGAWSRGEISACVLPERDYETAREKFQPAEVRLRSGMVRNKAYVLLTRPATP